MNISKNYEGHAQFMKRALQLSLYGGTNVSPNPFVGAVITVGDRIIGEGYHRQYGNAHAEVNAVNSVRPEDRRLLGEATMYVTLEPCSHYGKTPPCADLIIRCGIPKVFVATEDPFLKDYESGIEKMKNVDVDVSVGLLGEEARFINRRFFTAHTLKRPYILLKWAQSADGFISGKDGSPVKLSSDFTQLLVHRERAYYDAILAGPNTVVCDNPRLNCRLWSNRDSSRPLKVTFDSSRLQGKTLLEKGPLIKKPKESDLKEFMHTLYKDLGITSLMVEGGRHTLQSFLDAGLFDEVRIEISPKIISRGVEAPLIDKAFRDRHMKRLPSEIFGSHEITSYLRYKEIMR